MRPAREPKRRPPLVWSQSKRGVAIDLLEPRPQDVDFIEIAQVLGDINRYTGNTRVPVSVAQHTLLACALAPAELRPWVALHDAHEWILGDWTTPAVVALCRVAGELMPGAGAAVGRAVQELKRRHDVAIHAAAGLPMPTADQALGIHQADLHALVSERLHMLAPPPYAWSPTIEATAPIRKARDNRNLGLRKKSDVVAELEAAFFELLPALKNRGQ